MTSHHFTITAAPVPQPRPKVSTRGGFARAYYERNHPIHDWKRTVKEQAAPHMPPEPLGGPVRVQLAFTLPRPKGAPKRHPGPFWHVKSNADVDNLAKGVLDAMTDQGWWGDDGQVCALDVVKLVAGDGEVARCVVTVTQMQPMETQQW